MSPDRETVPGRPGLWYGRRRWIPFMATAIAIIAMDGFTAHRIATRLFDLALIVAAISRLYQFWTDPMPPSYAERRTRLDNEPRFGTKGWHKFAIGFVVLFVVWVAVAVVSSLLSR
jgi:hypothetical protein